MPHFKHILFPVDFSEQSCGGAPAVVSMAKRYGALVSLLHVMEIPALSYPGLPAFDFQSMVDLREKQVESFLKNEFHDVATKRVIEEGDSAGSIIRYAEKEEVDLIMMPTHGYGPYRGLLLGSVTAKVLHDAKCPVWTNAHVSKTPAAPSGLGSVLCAVDLTPKSLPLIQWASGFASDHCAVLTLVHVIPYSRVPTGLDIEGGRFRASLFDAARGALEKLRQATGVTFDPILEGGDVAAVVRRAAKEKGSDLIVIGRGVMQETFGRLRTNVYAIIREAPCPVISVPRDLRVTEAAESYYG
jgi:nucleotide-binding universal stress UspA family protein